MANSNPSPSGLFTGPFDGLTGFDPTSQFPWVVSRSNNSKMAMCVPVVDSVSTEADIPFNEMAVYDPTNTRLIYKDHNGNGHVFERDSAL
jgi:hypothetical protein